MVKLGPPIHPSFQDSYRVAVAQFRNSPNQFLPCYPQLCFEYISYLYNKYEAGPLLLAVSFFESLVWHLFTKKHGLRSRSIAKFPPSKAVEQEGSRFLQWKLEHGNKEATDTTKNGGFLKWWVSPTTIGFSY